MAVDQADPVVDQALVVACLAVLVVACLAVLVVACLAVLVVACLAVLVVVGRAKVKECPPAPAVVNLAKGRAEAPAVVNSNPRS